MIADQVLDDGLHAGPIVEDQARNARQLDADAAHRGVREPLDQPRHPARAAVGRQQRRDDDDAVDGVGSKQLVDGVVGGVQRLRRLDRPAIDQQQMMAGLAALRMEGVAELRFIPTAERIQVIEQHRDAKPMRRMPLLIPACGVESASITLDHPGIIGRSHTNLQERLHSPRPDAVELGVGRWPGVERVTLASRLTG